MADAVASTPASAFALSRAGRRTGSRPPSMRFRYACALSAVLALTCALPARANWGSDPTVNLPVCTAAEDQQMLDIQPDQYGGCWITWADNRVNFLSADIYVQHVLVQGVVDPAWPADGVLV